MSGAMVAVAIYTACSAADLTSTAVAQSRGGVEVNPILADSSGRVKWERAVTAKVAVTAGLVLIDHEIGKRDRKAARWFRVAVVAVHVWVVSHNLNVKGR